MLNEINAWLNSVRNYSKGVELYKKYGHNNTLKALFSKGKGNYTVNKLTQELIKLNSVGTKSEELPKTTIINGNHQPINQYPEPVQSWYKEALALLDTNKDRKTKMGLMVEDAMQKFNYRTELHKLNQYLLDQGSERLVHEHLESCFKEGKLWEKIAYWRKTGTIPDPELEIPVSIQLMDIHNLTLRQNVLRSRISQCKKKVAPRKFTKEARAEFRELNKKMIAEYQAELNQIYTRKNELV